MKTSVRSSFLALMPLMFLVSVNSQILPDTTKPTAYYLKIDASDLASSTTFKGTVKINITITESLTRLLIHSHNLTINTTSVAVWRKTMFSENGWSLVSISGVKNNGSLLFIEFTAPLSTSDYQVSMDFQGYYQDEMTGFAKIGYHFNKSLRYLAATNFEPTNARSVFPCFDKPEFRTSFVLEIVVDKTHLVLSNVKHTSVRNVTETTKMFRFDSFPPMPIYQLGWVVMDQASYTLRLVNTTSSVIHTRSPYLYFNNTEWAIKLSAKLVDKMSTLTGVNYILNKLEQVVVPELFMGTAEGYGIISYSEEAILVSPDKSSARYIQEVGLGLARGISQQWIGDIVSVDSWDYLWMMKGLNEYFKYMISANLPETSGWELQDQIVVELVQPALALDSNSGHPLNVNTQEEGILVQSVYDDLTRCKGGAILRMLQNVMGESLFNKALSVYIQNNIYKTSEPTVLWNIMYEAAMDKGIYLAKQSVDGIMKQWTDVAGYPILDVNLNGTHFNISQSNFGAWYVPVSYFLQNSPSEINQTWLLPGESLIIPASSAKWILVNVNQTGFFRVNYNVSLWNSLASQLSSDLTQLPHLNRAQLIDDLFALTLNGSLPINLLLQFTGYLRAESDYYPWFAALRNYENLIDKVYGYSSHQLLKTYVLDLMNGVVAQVGLTSKNEATHMEKRKQSLILEKACAFGHPACIQKAVSILGSWMAKTYFDADLTPALLCAGVANSSRATWYNVWDTYQYSVVTSVRLALLKSLTCSRDVPLLNEFLNNITSTSDPAVNSKDKTILLQTMSATPFGAQVILNWMIERLQGQMNSSDIPTSNMTTTAPENLTTTVAPSTSAELNTTSSNEAVKLLGNMTSGNLSQESVLSTPSPLEKSENVNPGISVKARDAVPLDPLSDKDITTILTYIVPKLTTIEAGTKLESFVILGNSTGLSYETLEMMKDVTKKIYLQGDWAMARNDKLTTWLEEEEATSTPGGGSSTHSSTTPTTSTTTPTPSEASGLLSSLTLCVLAVTLHTWQLL